MANPSLGTSLLPEEPDRTSPVIKINMPQKNMEFDINASVPYSITIDVPASWFSSQQIHGKLNEVGYILDGKEKVSIAGNNVKNGSKILFIPQFSKENPTVNLEGNLLSLPEGDHSIQVWVDWASLYHSPDTPQNFYGWWLAVYEEPNKTFSGTIHFSVTSQVVEPSNQVTNPTEQALGGESEPFQLLLVAAGIGAVIGIISLGTLLTYRKK